ncbi:MAG: hypothetical protein JWQ78_1415, partial [Sediminibacterium sp.]|nr:hypothetical protein [Sediminibacterium sp.]
MDTIEKRAPGRKIKSCHMQVAVKPDARLVCFYGGTGY